MTPVELVNAIELSGGTVAIAPRGERLCYRLPASAAMFLEDLRRMKLDILPVLRRREFAYLVPFIARRVWTPEGPGTLVRLEDFATVELEAGWKMRWYDPTAVIPYA